MERLKIEIQGIVQGVGFRPFIYRLARQHRLAGTVLNTPAGVTIEIEGGTSSIASFMESLPCQAPPLAVITSMITSPAPSTGDTLFKILQSSKGRMGAEIPSDNDVCDECLRELFNPADRRYRYPFINCTNCGPRYTLITDLPYDRERTTMASFAMCNDCREEYENPENRRFHAQPIACQVCGPSLRLIRADGSEVAGDPIAQTIDLLCHGHIVAIKGVGGFHLAVDPICHEAVAELRRRKKRDEKPFALMVPDIPAAMNLGNVDLTAERLLLSPERPIVLLQKREKTTISPLVSPANDYHGIMLPSSPLHHLLLRNQFAALIMTSGNISDEPMVFDNDDALSSLAGIADYFLVHDRPIRTSADDSVVRVFNGEPLFLRRSRGYVPRAVTLPAQQVSVLAVGAELKGAVCVTRKSSAFLSQHLGDLKNAATLESLADVVEHLLTLLEIKPDLIAHDLHPDYLSTSFAHTMGDTTLVGIQHHHAHMASCMAEHQLDEPVLGVIFDGLGYGLDGTLWGGEFLVGDYTTFSRVAHIAPVRMPGGDMAVKEPYRMALAHLHPQHGRNLLSLPLTWIKDIPANEAKLLLQMLERGINSPYTSSCGRLFDAAAAIMGVHTRATYEGQAAIELEGLAERSTSMKIYPYEIRAVNDPMELDFAGAISKILTETIAGRKREEMARTFHNTVAMATASMCAEIRKARGIKKIVLSGGVFQNKILTEPLVNSLQADHFTVYTHHLVPPNDGGLALGQAVIAARQTMMLRSEKCV